MLGITQNRLVLGENQKDILHRTLPVQTLKNVCVHTIVSRETIRASIVSYFR